MSRVYLKILENDLLKLTERIVTLRIYDESRIAKDFKAEFLIPLQCLCARAEAYDKVLASYMSKPLPLDKV